MSFLTHQLQFRVWCLVPNAELNGHSSGQMGGKGFIYRLIMKQFSEQSLTGKEGKCFLKD